MTPKLPERQRKSKNISIESGLIRVLLVTSTLINQLAIPILFIQFSSISNLGLWTLVVSAGSFAAILDLGLIQIMTTAAIQAFSKNKISIGKSIINDLFNYLFYVVIIVFSATLLVIILTLNSNQLHTETIQLMALCLFNYSLGLLIRFFEGTFRVLGKLTGLILLVGISYLDLLILATNLITVGSFTVILVEMVVVKIFLILVLSLKLQNVFPVLRFMRPKKVLSNALSYLRLGIVSLGMPLGYLALNETSSIFVGSVLGLETLGIFAILKSLSGVFRQVCGIFTISMQPKFTELISSNKIQTANVSFLKMRILLISLNTLLAMVLLASFNFLSTFIPALSSAGFFVYLIFLASSYIDIWWLIDSSIIVSTNKLEGLALRFLVSSVLGCAIGVLLLFQIGVSGMALGTLAIDFVLIPYAVKTRKRILNC